MRRGLSCLVDLRCHRGRLKEPRTYRGSQSLGGFLEPTTISQPQARSKAIVVLKVFTHEHDTTNLFLSNIGHGKLELLDEKDSVPRMVRWPPTLDLLPISRLSPSVCFILFSILLFALQHYGRLLSYLHHSSQSTRAYNTVFYASKSKWR